MTALSNQVSYCLVEVSMVLGTGKNRPRRLRSRVIRIRKRPLPRPYTVQVTMLPWQCPGTRRRRKTPCTSPF